MKIHLLYNKVGCVSAPKLAALMGAVGIRNTSDMKERPDWLIRWGDRRKVPFKPSKGTINSLDALDSYATRFEQLVILMHAGVRVPFFSTQPLGPWPTLARDYGDMNFQPTGGKGIHHYPEGTTVKHDFYMVCLPKKRQFRVDVIGGSSRIREILPAKPEEGVEIKDSPIWSYDNGYRFWEPIVLPPVDARFQAINAVKALGLDFGGVDVIWDGQVAWVLEVNTAPGLTPQTRTWYANTMTKYITTLSA